jgi:hypothetical protein
MDLKINNFIFYFFQIFLHLKDRVKLDQVAGLLNYDIMHIEVPKTIRSS